MKNHIKIFMLVMLSSLHLFSSNSVDRAIAYQHEQAGFSSADFDRDQDKNEKSKTPRTYATLTPQLQSSIYPKVNGTFYGAVNPAIDKALTVKSSGLSAAQRDRLWDNAMRAQMEEQGIEDRELGQISEKSIEGLRWSQLDCDEQRIAYLKNEWKDFRLSDDIIWPLIVDETKKFDDRSMSLFVAKVETSFSQKKVKSVEMKDLTKGLLFVIRDNFNRMALPFESYDRIMYLLDCMANLYSWMNPKESMAILYHEAAHGLIAISQPAMNKNVLGLSGKIQGLTGGVLQVYSQYKNNDSLSSQSLAHDQNLVDTKKHIMNLLGGPIGQQLSKGERLSFHDFLLSGNKFGQGSPSQFFSDMNKAYSQAIYYILYKDKNIIFDNYYENYDVLGGAALLFFEYSNDTEVMWQADALLEECYEQAFNFLTIHKSTLDQIVLKALEDEDRFISGSEMYELVGEARPKYEGEMTPIEKLEHTLAIWLAWTSKRVKYYQEQHPHD
ncbi:hypothetical protein KBC04_04455 [Candidatus Babeliales bacterium]|nr:hypothetical protein [Candidatus Babeliales bacterium]MBP9844072.1 hypothetical protein [Candidatus Babeliales bacterium]